MLPTEPLKKASGTNTDTSTTVTPTIAPWICPIALRVAARGSNERLHHLRDRDLDEARAVVRDAVLDALREVARELVHALADRRRGGQRIARRRQLHADAGGRPAVEPRRRGVGLRAELDAR